MVRDVVVWATLHKAVESLAIVIERLIKALLDVGNLLLDLARLGDWKLLLQEHLFHVSPVRDALRREGMIPVLCGILQ